MGGVWNQGLAAEDRLVPGCRTTYCTCWEVYIAAGALSSLECLASGKAEICCAVVGILVDEIRRWLRLVGVSVV